MAENNPEPSSDALAALEDLLKRQKQQRQEVEALDDLDLEMDEESAAERFDRIMNTPSAWE